MMLAAVVRDPFTTFAVDCGLGLITLAVVFYTMLRLFQRNHQDGDATHHAPKF
jgi:hypothetical protein